MTTFNTLIRKASTLLKLGSDDSPQKVGLDGEAIFCKNNVCVHPPTPLRTEMLHHPGYLSIKEQNDEILGSTLILTWIPNSTLKKNPRSLENRTPGSSPCRSSHSSTCPSPTISGRSPFHLPFSGCNSPYACSEKSVEEFSQLGSRSHHSDRRSISSTISDIGSPREDFGSLDSFSASDQTEMTASTSSQPLSVDASDLECNEVAVSNLTSGQSGEKCQESVASNTTCSIQSQSDSGIGPEEVIAALEIMISGLNDMDNAKSDPKVSEENSVKQSLSSSESELDEMSQKTSFISKSELPQMKSRGHHSSSEVTGDNSFVDSLINSTNSEVSDIHTSKTESYPDISVLSSMNMIQNNFNHSDGKIRDSKQELCNIKNAKSSLSSDVVNILSNKQYDERESEMKCSMKLNLKQNLNEDVQEKIIASNPAPNINISSYTPVDSDSSSTTPTTSNKDPESFPSTPADSPPPSPLPHMKANYLYVEGTPESLAHAHNLIFPDTGGQSPSKLPRRENSCGTFSVDLSQMRSLRLFFSNKECTCGQLVIASRESQYKILHFHYGGLDRLANVFEEYNFLSKSKSKLHENCPYRQFSVCRPELTAAECHPEEGIYNMVDEVVWRGFMHEDGVIEDNFQLRKEIFFAGLDQKLRKESWPFLLHHYNFHSTFDEREQIRNDKYIEYQAIRRKRDQMTSEEREIFWKNIQCTVEKDVVRTDRSNPFFAGDDNPNIEVMKNILLNYAVYNPAMGYTQGMSDLLAPVLAEVQDEAETFWCFVGLMQNTIFVTSPKDSDMDTNLSYLRELFRLMTPKFYAHLLRNREALELLFVHRWILLCFKREFPEQEAMRMWESCWAHYQTDYFHLFLCSAIVAIYGDDIIAQDLRPDEMLVHFSSLAMHMNGELVLRKARGLLHQFRLLPRIPCSLAKLCELCGPGMWDSGHVPVINCIGNHGNHSCPYGGQDPMTKVI